MRKCDEQNQRRRCDDRPCADGYRPWKRYTKEKLITSSVVLNRNRLACQHIKLRIGNDRLGAYGIAFPEGKIAISSNISPVFIPVIYGEKSELAGFRRRLLNKVAVEIIELQSLEEPHADLEDMEAIGRGGRSRN
jgi:hypothetical protein